jgi:hypothetical protein
MENIVEREAKQFSNRFFRNLKINNLENLKLALTSKLYEFKRDKDKLFFLTVLRKEVENDKLIHEKTCNTKNCEFSQERDLGLFLIDQEIDDISEFYEFKPKTDDEFSIKERADFHNKLNEIAERLEKLGYGQEILFEEIESLKENFNLGKKNWFQLLKGKLIDLGLQKVLNEKIINDLYKELSNGFESVKTMIEN